MLPDNDPLTALLLRLELELMDPAVRKDRAFVSASLSRHFREFGSSGRMWNKDEILHLLGTEDYSPPAIEDVRAQPISADAVLLTYRAVRSEHTTLRSSIWVREDNQWRMLFHQGTKAQKS